MKTFPTLVFQYRLPAVNAILMVLAAFATTGGLGYFALHAPDARITRTISTLFSPEAAPLFLWALTAISFTATLLVVWFAVHSQTRVHHVELGSSHIVAPQASLSSKSISIPYTSISQLQVVKVSGQKMAIISSGKNQSRLLENSFSSTDRFLKFLHVLHERRNG
ncbi:hypothetical protein [Chitinolyticbacter albus]|uniref:hypothetical protein n=1 Tax=Chitinolyticbacter albus TaxID=2961951 RepID=UPI002109E17C|nr:hypothetical protein [Chitinolyticbacter albus]